jgi:phosphate/sulfate permease
MRSVLAAILVFEAIIVVLAIPVAVAVSGVDGTVAGAVGAGVAVGCLVVTGLLRYQLGRIAGSVVQVVAIGLGFVVPLMFVLGAIFAVLWFVCLRLDRRITAERAERVRQGERAESERAESERAESGPAESGPAGSGPAKDEPEPGVGPDSGN